VLTVMPLVCTKLLRKKSGLAMRPLGLMGGASWRNSGNLAGELDWGVAGEDLGLARARLYLRRGGGRRVGAAWSGDGHRGSGCSGEDVAGPRQQTTTSSPTGPREDACVAAQLGKGADPGA
jgi:hypothetical protein